MHLSLALCLSSKFLFNSSMHAFSSSSSAGLTLSINNKSYMLILDWMIQITQEFNTAASHANYARSSVF